VSGRVTRGSACATRLRVRARLQGFLAPRKTAEMSLGTPDVADVGLSRVLGLPRTAGLAPGPWSFYIFTLDKRATLVFHLDR